MSDSIFNILLHSELNMSIGIQLSKIQFKNMIVELSPKYRKQLLKIYKKYVKILGDEKVRHRIAH